MVDDPNFKPRLRPVEVFRGSEGDGATIGLRDRSGLSDVVLSMSAPALQILALMDGEHTLDAIQRGFLEAYGQRLSGETLNSILRHLEQAHFLEGAAFENHYQSLLDDYRRGGVREMPHAEGLGIEATGSVFREMLGGRPCEAVARRVAGLVAPHLDYPRGGPCYAAGYGSLRNQPGPRRVIILGTNHFGRSLAVVGTGNDFVTPLGTTRADGGFLEKLEAGCGSLRRYELDHVREHSVELQVAWLQFLFGADSFTIVPFLCPDPCGPTGTSPVDGGSPDLRDFALCLRELIAPERDDTLVVAGADLSHVGAAFGDERMLDDTFLAEVRARDGRALDRLIKGDADGFRICVADEGNPTRVCSAGCLYALAVAVGDAQATLLGYHQAVDQPSQTCVTCAAVAYA